jgi:putative PIN family toxin of toxin-antitoxin system
MMLRITLDTNVLISGTFWEGEAYEIMKLIEQKKALCFLSKEILDEYNRVMHSDEIIEKAGEHHLKIKSAVIKVIEICTIVEPLQKVIAVEEDPEDNKILECALEANADYVITYDGHLLKLKEFGDIKIISPSEFLKIV